MNIGHLLILVVAASGWYNSGIEQLSKEFENEIRELGKNFEVAIGESESRERHILLDLDNAYNYIQDLMNQALIFPALSVRMSEVRPSFLRLAFSEFKRRLKVRFNDRLRTITNKIDADLARLEWEANNLRYQMSLDQVSGQLETLSAGLGGILQRIATVERHQRMARDLGKRISDQCN